MSGHCHYCGGLMHNWDLTRLRLVKEPPKVEQFNGMAVIGTVDRNGDFHPVETQAHEDVLACPQCLEAGRHESLNQNKENENGTEEV